MCDVRKHSFWFIFCFGPHGFCHCATSTKPSYAVERYSESYLGNNSIYCLSVEATVLMPINSLFAVQKSKLSFCFPNVQTLFLLSKSQNFLFAVQKSGSTDSTVPIPANSLSQIIYIRLRFLCVDQFHKQQWRTQVPRRLKRTITSKERMQTSRQSIQRLLPVSLPPAAKYVQR